VTEAEELSYDDAPAISALLTFLMQYSRGEFPFEDIKTFPQPSSAPAS
jgi:hypothetical protein